MRVVCGLSFAVGRSSLIYVLAFGTELPRYNLRKRGYEMNTVARLVKGCTDSMLNFNVCMVRVHALRGLAQYSKTCLRFLHLQMAVIN